MDIYKQTVEISNKTILADKEQGKVPAELIPAVEKELNKKDKDTINLLLAIRNSKIKSSYPDQVTMMTRAMLGRTY